MKLQFFFVFLLLMSYVTANQTDWANCGTVKLCQYSSLCKKNMMVYDSEFEQFKIGNETCAFTIEAVTPNNWIVTMMTNNPPADGNIVIIQSFNGRLKAFFKANPTKVSTDIPKLNVRLIPDVNGSDFAVQYTLNVTSTSDTISKIVGTLGEATFTASPNREINSPIKVADVIGMMPCAKADLHRYICLRDEKCANLTPTVNSKYICPVGYQLIYKNSTEEVSSKNFHAECKNQKYIVFDVDGSVIGEVSDNETSIGCIHKNCHHCFRNGSTNATEHTQCNVIKCPMKQKLIADRVVVQTGKIKCSPRSTSRKQLWVIGTNHTELKSHTCAEKVDCRIITPVIDVCNGAEDCLPLTYKPAEPYVPSCKVGYSIFYTPPAANTSLAVTIACDSSTGEWLIADTKNKKAEAYGHTIDLRCNMDGYVSQKAKAKADAQNEKVRKEKKETEETNRLVLGLGIAGGIVLLIVTIALGVWCGRRLIKKDKANQDRVYNQKKEDLEINEPARELARIEQIKKIGTGPPSIEPLKSVLAGRRRFRVKPKEKIDRNAISPWYKKEGFPTELEKINQEFQSMIKENREPKYLRNEYEYRKEDLLWLTRKAAVMFKREPRLLEIESPVIVTSDIHGQFFDLVRYFKNFSTPKTPGHLAQNYLFLGDYVDRGSHSIEVVATLFMLKLQYPNKFLMLRGNHESPDICCAGNGSKDNSFKDECIDRYGEEGGDAVFEAFTDAFACLPIMCIIDDMIGCMHGGICPNITREGVKKIQCPLPYLWDNQLACDIAWADPDEKENMFKLNQNRGYEFGKAGVDKALECMNLSCIIRGHQVKKQGLEYAFGGKVVTIFSASKVTGRDGGDGAVIQISPDGNDKLHLFKPLKIDQAKEKLFRNYTAPKEDEKDLSEKDTLRVLYKGKSARQIAKEKKAKERLEKDEVEDFGEPEPVPGEDAELPEVTAISSSRMDEMTAMSSSTMTAVEKKSTMTAIPKQPEPEPQSKPEPRSSNPNPAIDAAAPARSARTAIEKVAKAPK